MNGKTKTAMAVLAAGGFFKKWLGADFRGFSKFQTALFDVDGHRVQGVGPATLRAIDAMGCLSHDIGCAGTVEHWRLCLPVDAAQAVALDAVLDAA